MSIWDDYKQAIDPADWMHDLTGKSPWDAASPYFNQAMNEVNRYGNQAIGYMNPYMQHGEEGLAGESHLLGQLANPAANYNHLMSGFQMSPAQQFAQKQGLNAVSNNMATKGLMGSSVQGKALENYAQNNTSAAQQQYLQNLSGMQDRALQGYGGMAQLGENAAGNAGQYAMGMGNADANLAEAMAQANAAQANSNRQGLYGLLGQGMGLLGEGAMMGMF